MMTWTVNELTSYVYYLQLSLINIMIYDFTKLNDILHNEILVSAVQKNWHY